MKSLSSGRNSLHLLLLTVLSSFLSIHTPVSAQSTQALVEKWRDTDFNFTSGMLDTDSNRDAYVLGSNAATNTLVIKKFNASGVLQWETLYDDPVYNLRAVWIATDPAYSAVVVANIVRSTDGQPEGWLTLKYDTLGNLLWVNPLPRAVSSAARLAVDPFGNIYVAGTGVLTKYSPLGATLWQDDSGAVGHPHSMAVSLLGDRIAIAGRSNPTSVDFRAVMYDSSGNLLWTNTSAAPYPADDVAFHPNFDNETYFATGTYSPLDANPYQMAIVKFDAAGNLLWVRGYGVGDRTHRLVATGGISGGIVATGVDASGYLDWMTIKTDFEGNLLWSQRYDGTKTNDEIPKMVEVGLDGGIYVTGKGGPTPASGNISLLKGVVAKYAADGAPQWAVWDEYAGGMAVRTDKVDPMGAPLDLTTLGWGYLTTTGYSQTGQPDLLPGAPSNLSGFVGSSNSSVTLNFTDNATNEFWVEGERCTGSGCTNFSNVGQSLGENATSLSDTTVAPGVTYTYRVRARGFMGLSGPSNSIVVSVPGLNPPAAPGNLTAAGLSRSQIRLAWKNNSSNQDNVKIERCKGTNCANFTQIANVAGTATAYIDAGLSSNTTYRYRVRASNSAGASPYSNIASAKTPNK